jgi:hypothetical protein
LTEEVSKHLATKEKLNETEASHAAVLGTLEQEKSSHITTRNELSENRVSLHENELISLVKSKLN